MNILGVHLGHDASAAIVIDGGLTADAAEERFSRVKHDAGLPVNAVAACLKTAGLDVSDIDVLAVPTQVELWPLNDLFDLWGRSQEQDKPRTRLAEARRRGGPLGPALPGRRPLHAHRFPLPARTEVVHVGHHLAHAASAYYTSGRRDRQVIVTLDGIGERVSGAVWRGEGGRIEPLEQFGPEGSLGWFYGNVTEALGWAHGDGEGTTMALAAYGESDTALDALEEYHPRFENGALVRPHEFEPIGAWSHRGAFQWHSPEAERIARLIPRFGREQLAAAAQRVLEEQVTEIVDPWLEREGTRVLSCSGGVFLNVKVNQRIWQSGNVDHHHIYPNPGDGGLAAGAALHAYYQAHPEAPIDALRHVYLGPTYSDEEIGRLLSERRLEAVRRDDVPEYAARLLAENLVVGWVQGAMESGPRALGGRSILVNPGLAENKCYLDARVKFREGFRPYCPSLAAERAADYLERGRPERFMITSFDVDPGKRGSIPAVVHADGTARPQTVERDVNPRYWQLIAAFADLTGEHAVLNTSFNVRGEPIVCHPRDAIRTFFDTGMDCLILGDHVLRKPLSRRPFRGGSS